MKCYNTLKKNLEKRGARYLIVGGLNTIFGYLCGIYLYYLLLNKLEIIFILLISNILSISFSFITYKLIVFRTSGNWLIEYAKCYVVYGGISVIGMSLTWLFLDFFNLNIWISQALSIFLITFISYYGHKKFTFNKNNE